MSLSKYKAKRRFGKTPEPEGLAAESHRKLIFVVQKHLASHLHYDFRLEMDGVLKSWAVPKGPSLNPSIKRLAMMVEDHPYDYKDFEGEIPKGNYGAGQVIVWDNGTYEPRTKTENPEKELIGQLSNGHITFILHGKKLKGEFALIKNGRAGDNAWLLIKKTDAYASSRDVIEDGSSVISGEKIEKEKAEEPPDVSAQPKSDLPRLVRPMLATLADKPFDDKNYLFEIKWDGYRALLSKAGNELKLYSRTGQSFNDKYAPIVESAREIDSDFLIDGEITVLDKEGRAQFGRLQDWQKRKRGQLIYYVFDILWLNGYELTGLPLKERKEVLNSLFGKSGRIRYSDHVQCDGKRLFKAAEAQGLEGIMAKRAESLYQAGRRSRDWLKIKTHLRQEAVIGGFTEPRGGRKHLGALILGVYGDDGELIYIGHTGGGIASRLMPELRQRLEKIERKTSPFQEKIKPNAPVHWVRPQFVCEVSFGEWTREGHMRHPIFIGLREDKAAKDVHMEKSSDPPPNEKPHDKKVKFTHRDKIFWPKAGYTKGDLIGYYESNAELILPYLKDRPHSLLRQLNGIDGESFFQKDVDHTPPPWVKTKAIYSESNGKDINYLVCDSADSLMYMVQLGCIEINPWNSRIDSLERPDWVVIDLDPEAIAFDAVIRTATAAKDVLSELKIPSYPKTSGKTGLHIYIPTAAKYDYEQAKQFAQLLAGLIHRRVPNITSLKRSPKERQRKVYIDFLQNRKGQTLAAPYSVRPTPDASISTPLHWDEVDEKLKPAAFTIKTMPKRIADVGDLWRPVVGKGVDIKEIISRLEK